MERVNHNRTQGALTLSAARELGLRHEAVTLTRLGPETIFGLTVPVLRRPDEQEAGNDLLALWRQSVPYFRHLLNPYTPFRSLKGGVKEAAILAFLLPSAMMAVDPRTEILLPKSLKFDSGTTVDYREPLSVGYLEAHLWIPPLPSDMQIIPFTDRSGRTTRSYKFTFYITPTGGRTHKHEISAILGEV